jgi:hypothetical protein
MDTLQQLLNDLHDPGKRFAAIIALGRLNFTPAVKALLPFVKDPNVQVQWAAVQTLGWLGDPAAVPALINALPDSEPVVRVAIVYALGLIGDSSALKPLASMLHDPTPDVFNKDQSVSDVARQAMEQIRQHQSASPPETPTPAEETFSPEWAEWTLKGILELTGAERGYVVLKNPQSGAFEFQAGTGIERDQLNQPQFVSSRLVIQEAAHSGEPILTDNASRDAGFQGSEGVINFQLRQLIAIPLKQNDEVIGVVYCDQRLMKGLFRQDALEQAAAYADKALNLSEHPLLAEPLPAADIDPASVISQDEFAPTPKTEAAPPPMIQPAPAPAAPKPAAAESTESPDKLKEALAPLGGSLAEPEPDELADTAGAVPLDDGLVSPPPLPVQNQEFYLEQRREGGETTSPAPTTGVTAPSSEVEFSAFYPGYSQVNRQHGLYVYAHLPGTISAIAQDVERFKEELGGEIPAPRTAKQTVRLQHETPITLVPECDELEFEPPELTRKWRESWVRFDFNFQPKAELQGEMVMIRVSARVNGIEIAHINCPVEIVEQLPVAQVDNPLAAAKMICITSKIYERIFISYSRHDQTVADAYRLAQLALGNDVFMDSYSIRVGEDWRAALARAIDSADIFQLFWSKQAALSENVRDEWDYALHYRCPDTRCEAFIRPVFWEKPMPEPPPALSHLNFRFVPLTQAKPSDG